MANPSFKELRRLAGCTQVSLASRTGINRVRLSLAETGQLRLRPEEKVKILRTLMREMERSSSAIKKARQALSNQDPPALAGETPLESLTAE